MNFFIDLYYQYIYEPYIHNFMLSHIFLKGHPTKILSFFK